MSVSQLFGLFVLSITPPNGFILYETTKSVAVNTIHKNIIGNCTIITFKYSISMTYLSGYSHRKGIYLFPAWKHNTKLFYTDIARDQQNNISLKFELNTLSGLGAII